MFSRLRSRWLEVPGWYYGRAAYGVFATFFTIGVTVLLASLTPWKTFLVTGDKVVLSVVLLTGAVVLWQGLLLNRQLAYGTVLDLYKEWNSHSMREMRRNAWTKDREGPNPDAIEDILEFLEKVSTLEKDRYITRRLVWDTFGWYVGRYFFYCKEEIPRLRTKWTPLNPDFTLYQDLESLYDRLLADEARERKLKKQDIEEEYKQTRNKFILSEME